MQADYLIVGQGLSGTMLSWYLHKAGKSFLVMDRGDENTASKAAAGIINPVTGRRYAYTWMIDEIMPFAVEAFRELQHYLGQQLIDTKTIIDFFPSAQMRNAFIDRLSENDTYLHSYSWQNQFNPDFNYDFGCGEIRPAYQVDVSLLLRLWQQELKKRDRYVKNTFLPSELKIRSGEIQYNEIIAERIILCDGISAAQNPWFHLLPFAPNKGEVLIIECEGLNNEHIFKKGFMLSPLSEPNRYWLGSNYQWEFADDKPSELFYSHATSVLNNWLKKPYKVVEHKAAVRPATIERRPFVGFHPMYPSIGILNGMGTKGASLAPFFANQLVQQLIYNFPITPEADVHRFMRVLSR